MRNLLKHALPVFWLVVAAAWLAAADCDFSSYRARQGLTATKAREAAVITWDGEPGSRLRLRLAIVSGVPTIQEMAVERRGTAWSVLGRNLTPVFTATTGIRRTGHGLPEENRWDVFWDAPLQKRDEVRHHAALFQAASCSVKTDGSRLEINFPGAHMGIFTGSLQFTVYRGTNLVRQELIARTGDPSVAYIYTGGLRGFAVPELDSVEWKDVDAKPQRHAFGASADAEPVALRARHRMAIATGKAGSVAVFPPPHQFFFARELEINLGYVWYQGEAGPGPSPAAATFGLGVRQHPTEEGYNRTWIERVYALYNAPPGTWQRMAVYFYPTTGDASAAERAVLAFTHADQYKPLPGYQVMATHFHTAFTDELMKSGSLDTVPPWIPAMKALGINIAHIFDFHGDGHPRDPGPLRLRELENYFEACRRHSTAGFLILPGEEANEYLGGHYNIVFPRPVYWTHVREPGRELIEQDPKYGTVYRTANAADVLEMMKRENALVWQTHPRTKGSTFYPDLSRERDYFRSDRWLGAAFKSMPVDLSQKRLCEVRCFGTLDDMNNWDGPKYLVGEVDTYKKWPQDDLYGHFVVNYVKLHALPGGGDWSPLLRALRAGDFFVTTGEVLIPHFSVERNGKTIRVVADVEWTFPLEFAEVVWGDGSRVSRRVQPLTGTGPFGRERIAVNLEADGVKWVRFAAWDSAVNGAFTQPVHLEDGNPK